MSAQAKLYQYAACPFCRKVRAGLRFKGIPFEAIEVHPLNKKEISFSKEYKKVPIFVDSEGVQVNDSSAILKHLDSLKNERALFSHDASQLQKEVKWMKWADEKLVRALSPVIYATLPKAWESFGYISKVCNFSFMQKLVIRTVGALVMWRVAAKKAKELEIVDPSAHLNDLLETLGKQVQTGFLSGSEMPSCADITVWGYLDCLRELPAFSFVEQNSSVKSWMDRVQDCFLS